MHRAAASADVLGDEMAGATHLHARPAGPGGDSTRRRLLLAAFAVLLALGLVLLVERAAGYRAVFDHLRRARPEWLAVALAAEAVSFAGFVACVRGALGSERGPLLGYGACTRLVFASLGAARAVAGGGAAGIATFYWAFRKAGVARDEAAARVVALYGTVFGVFVAGTWLCALATVAAAGGVVVPELTLPWLLGAPVLFVAARSVRAPEAERVLLTRVGAWVQAFLANAEAGIRRVRQVVARPRRHATSLVGALAYWSGDVVCLWAALHAFDVGATPARLVLAYSTAYLLTLLPLPLGGVGTVEAAATVLLRAVGIPVSAGLLAVLAYRAVTFWLPTLPGLLAFATLGGLGRRLEHGAASRRVRALARR